MSSHASSYTINIKRIRNKYDINLNMIVESTPVSIIYEGYRLNTSDINEVLIEVIPLKNQIIPLKISHPYIIQFEDAIYDPNYLYIVYPNYKLYNKINIKNQYEFNKFFNEFRELIQFIINNNIDIEPIKLCDIYIKNNIYVLIHKKQQSKNIIRYGSPIYSPPEFFNKKELYITEKILWNVGIILYEIIKRNSPYIDCKDLKEILITSRIIFFEETEEDIFLKRFLNANISERISLKDFLEIDISKYNFFNREYIEKKEINDKDKNNKEETEMFEMDL